ncbi:MAG: S-layer homology domain-containing protein [Clostridia bacterium]|nr:S-layer homology domain-containing protein [Clostridia bacterium]
MKNLLKKIVSIICVVALLGSFTVFGAEYKDIPDDWSKEGLVKAIEAGLLNGDGGFVRPTDPMTRAEMGTIMTRAFGAVKTADISMFKDVKKDDWFYDYMAKAVAMGAFKGDGENLRPNSNISRQEAMVVLSRLFAMESDNLSILDQFKDKNKIQDWAKAGVAAVVESGYVKGSDGMVNPAANITRAEFATIMSRMVGGYFVTSSVFTYPEGTVIEENIVIRSESMTLKNIVSPGIIIIGDGVDGGEITLENVTSTGMVLIRGNNLTADLTTGTYKNVKVLGTGVTVKIGGDNIESLDIGEGNTIDFDMTGEEVAE